MSKIVCPWTTYLKTSSNLPSEDLPQQDVLSCLLFCPDIGPGVSRESIHNSFMNESHKSESDTENG